VAKIHKDIVLENRQRTGRALNLIFCSEGKRASCSISLCIYCVHTGRRRVLHNIYNRPYIWSALIQSERRACILWSQTHHLFIFIYVNTQQGQQKALAGQIKRVAMQSILWRRTYWITCASSFFFFFFFLFHPFRCFLFISRVCLAVCTGRNISNAFRTNSTWGSRY